MVQLMYMTTGKTIALTIWTFVGKVMSLLFNALSRFAIAFLPRSKSLNFMAAVTIHSDLDPKKIQSVTVSTPLHFLPLQWYHLHFEIVDISPGNLDSSFI